MEAPQTTPVAPPGAGAPAPAPAAGPSAPAPAVSLFGQARERAREKALPAGPFLSGDERSQMYVARSPFWIVDAMKVEADRSEYGPRSRFIVVFSPDAAPDGNYTAETSRTLDLQASDFRDALVDEVKALLPTHKIVGPVYLRKFSTRSGNAAWDISDEPPGADEIPY